MHTKPTTALARGRHHDRHRRRRPPLRLLLTPDDLALDEHARRLVVEITDRDARMEVLAHSEFRWVIYRLRRVDHRACPVVGAGKLLLILASAGATEAECRSIVLFLDGVVAALFAGNNRRALEAIERDEFDRQVDEDRATQELRLAGESPERLRTLARAARAEAAVELERAGSLERRARQLAADARVFPPAA